MAKSIVITGVSRGLGRAMTEGFIRAGHTVFGCARSEGAVKELNQQFGSPHQFTVVDVVSDAQVKTWAHQLLAECNPPDLLINNAATINHLAPLWQISADEFSYLIDINIKGVANVIRHFVPAMISRRTGVIVNFSSSWGRSTSPLVCGYCTSKWAIEGMTRSLAQELPRGIAAVTLDPGIVYTNMAEVSNPKNVSLHTSIEVWKQKAVPFLLNLTPDNNPKSIAILNDL